MQLDTKRCSNSAYINRWHKKRQLVHKTDGFHYPFNALKLASRAAVMHVKLHSGKKAANNEGCGLLHRVPCFNHPEQKHRLRVSQDVPWLQLDARVGLSHQDL